MQTPPRSRLDANDDAPPISDRPPSAHPQARHQSHAALTLAALGIVYGDIGTSPLYAVKETFNPSYGIPLIAENVIGGISAIFWSLMIVVSLKYVTLMMRADNRGEGGIMALLALASSSVRSRPRLHGWVLTVGLIGAALFYGDAVLTPAISVLSAVEGLEVGTSALKPYVLPISVGVLIGLFVAQKHGSAIVGAIFGPITVVWFIAIAAAGVHGILQRPEILHALNPLHGLGFVTRHGVASFLVLGAVLLAFTGAEALYADMGHFGKKPIRMAWFGLVFPALALNYLGQGALLIGHPAAVKNPFYLLCPAWALYPLVGLATAATVIASQATISGTYSLTKQAIQLGFLPRMRIIHTSERHIGQIYLPGVNWILLAMVIMAVLGFGSSSSLAGAYGVAVTGTMLVTTFLTFFVIRYSWRYNLLVCIASTGFFLLVDAAFFSSSLMKIADGGWFPLTLGTLMLTIMLTWAHGRKMLLASLRGSAISVPAFLESLRPESCIRVPGTAVFLTAAPEVVPHSFLHNLKHNWVVHEHVVFLTVVVKEVPWIEISDRASIESLGHEFYRITLYFGFKDEPNVATALADPRVKARTGLDFDLMSTSFFLSRQTIIPKEEIESGMAFWRDRLFATMTRNAGSAVEHLGIPSNRVVELGTVVEI
jgi:KUP system potassium uptake protein